MKWIILMAVMLVGCDKSGSRGPGVFTIEACVNGVVYYKSGYQLAPAFKPDGSLYTCDPVNNE